MNFHRCSRCFIWISCLLLVVASAWTTPADAQANKGGSPSTSKAPPKPKLPTPQANVEIKITPVKSELRDAALKSAARIDELVDEQLKKVGLKPNPPSTDEQFVRRVHLDITGTIPTSKQTETFLKYRGENKRVLLIDSLLNRPGYASHNYNWLADTLRLVDRVDFYNYLRPYSQWVKQGLRENRPWDQMVRQMITSEGRVVDNPPVGYFLRDPGMPLDNLNNTVRVFMGTRIGCAQCHDHPFDRWTQKEFYQLAAFFGGLDFNLPKERRITLRDADINAVAADLDSPEARIARQMVLAGRKAVTEDQTKQLKFPRDYADDESLRGKLVTPAVLFGETPNTFSLADRRRLFADWLTSPENPRFALSMANRLWKRAMGVGLIEPVDDIHDDTVASNPELLRFLTSELVRLKFDLKELQRIIFYTKTYQRRVTYDDIDPAKPYHFPGPALRRMSAEQVWDSLLALTLTSPDQMLRPDEDEYLSVFYIDNTLTPKQILERAKQVDEMRKEQQASKKLREYKGNELVRASELPQPLPEGHFLRQFGQSDRSAIADSHTDGTVPQLLTLFNGPVTHMMLEEGSVIYNEVVSQKALDDQLERIFLCLLSRKPTGGERTAAQKEIRTAGAAGFGNVIWAMLNTREFLFIQ